jgi:hypothetical protein
MTLPLTYKKDNCFINAYINHHNHYLDKKLRIVFGSFAINGWFEFGGKNWTKKDFIKNMTGTYTTDAHCWLEDEDGNVYDYIHDGYDFWVKIRTNKPMKFSGLVEGMSKADLLGKNIEYVPADKETQQMIFLRVLQHCREAERRLKDGSAMWNGNYLAFVLV